MSFRTSRRRLAALAATVVWAVALVAYVGVAQGSGSAGHEHGRGHQRDTIGLFGDMPPAGRRTRDRRPAVPQPRTVEWHLSEVFGKLGIASRKELRTALSDVGATV